MNGDIMRRDAAQSIIEVCQMGLDPERSEPGSCRC